MVPQDLKDAFVAIEDARFYDHNGIDIKGIIRAGMVGMNALKSADACAHADDGNADHADQKYLHKGKRYRATILKELTISAIETMIESRGGSIL